MQTSQIFRLRATRFAFATFASVVSACAVAGAKAKKQLLI
jgi:hypothetical protein